MCGISVIVKRICVDQILDDIKLPVDTICKLKRRGPDFLRSESVLYNKNICLNFCASVLHLRGDRRAALQPFVDDFGNVVLWNGEIFGGKLYSDGISDTSVLSNALAKCSSSQDVLEVITEIRGPFAFVYFQKNEGLVWFGRDVLGRRSLLWSFTDERFVLSSVASEKQACYEVPCEGLYCLDLAASQKSDRLIVNFYPWTHTLSGLAVLQSSPLIFDSTLLQMIVSDVRIQPCIKMPLNRTLQVDNFFYDLPNEELFGKFLSCDMYANAVIDFESLLSRAVELRVQNQLSLCKDCVLRCDHLPCCHSSISILFSGGLDSIVIALLVDKFLPNAIAIDLLNVAFECTEKVTSCNKKRDGVPTHFKTPDRITGLQGLQELKVLNPNRQWNFVEIDVTQSELEEERRNSISDLIFPSRTVLDDSIGCALWFAARGSGTIQNSNGEKVPYCSPSRVVLVGMGADELLAGYSRHRGKFSSGGWQALIDEMALEIDRISSRNLCRDDRIISDHGREVRHPFLDENVISFLNQLPVYIKTDLRYDRGIGEKLLLRLLAYKLGLRNAAFLPKRAIQFGSRIARCENTREKGSDICGRLAKAKVS